MPAPLHIAHLASADLWAGAEVMLCDLVSAQIADPQTKVSVYLLNPGRLQEELTARGVDVVVLNETRLNPLQIALSLHRHLRRSRPDCLHTHRTKENVIGALVAWLLRIPSLRTQHGAAELTASQLGFAQRCVRWLDRQVARRVQRMTVAVSQALETELLREMPGLTTTVVGNGVDVERLRQMAQAPLDATVSLSAEQFHIGIVGRLVPVKRVDVFLDVLAALAGEGVRGVVAGDGPLEQTLRARARKLGLDEAATFLGEVRNSPALIQRLDALLVTSDHEGVPMVVLEALALGTPVVAHAVGGIIEIAARNPDLLLCSEQSPSAFAARCRQLRNEPRRAPAALRDYDNHTTARHYSTLYHRLRRSSLQDQRQPNAH